MSDKQERIPLRAMALVWPGDASVRGHYITGIALPDGRFIFHGSQTYSSEVTMLRHNPGAHLEWAPESATEIINYVEIEE